MRLRLLQCQTGAQPEGLLLELGRELMADDVHQDDLASSEAATPRPLLRRPISDRISTTSAPTATPRIRIEARPGVQRILCFAENAKRFADVHVILADAINPLFSIEHVHSNAEVFRALAASEVDVVLAEVDRDIEAWRLLVRDPRVSGIPLIVVDAVGTPAQRSLRRRGFIDEGADGYLLRCEMSGPLVENAIFTAIDRCRTRKALSEVQERFALAVRGSNGGVWEWVLESGEIHFSRRWCDLLGYSSQELSPSVDEWFDRVHPSDLAQLKADIDQHLAGNKPFHESEHRLQAGDGSYRWVVSRGVVHRDWMGRAVRMAGSLTDLSDYRDREEKLREQNRYDCATGLPRRELFVERLAAAIYNTANGMESGFSALMVDVDRFRWLSDSVGHQAADRMLVLLARRLLNRVGADGLVARLGGDKFAVLLPGIASSAAVAAIAQGICEAARDPFELDEQALYVTVSIGATTTERRYVSAEDVLNDVAVAVNRAKERGQDRVEFYEDRMRDEAVSSLKLETALRKAVERGEFELYYQPIVCLRTGALTGFEALCRWNHPQRGLVLPNEFVGLAEQTGLVVPLGRWAIDQAVTQLREWQSTLSQRGPLSMSVNLSTRQLTDPELLVELDNVLRREQLAPGLLRLELTESVLIDNAARAVRILERLREIGARIWVDDFGTGYSSLSYLHRFPVDGLKIDKAFVDILDGSERSAAMVRTIVGLAQALHVDVIAEGIETPEQGDLLYRLGCARGQGYLYGEPMPAANITALYAGSLPS